MWQGPKGFQRQVGDHRDIVALGIRLRKGFRGSLSHLTRALAVLLKYDEMTDIAQKTAR